MENTVDFEAQIAQMEKTSKVLAQIDHIITVVSGKGGVGKTTVSVEIARKLQASGKQVGILDVDLHGPNVAVQLGVTEQLLSDDGVNVIPSVSKEGIKVVSLSLALSKQDDPIIWRGPMKIAAVKQFIADTIWGRLDYLIIDTPPGSGDEQMTLFQTIKQQDGCIIVSTSQELSISDCRKSINFVRAMKQNIIGLVENMSYFVCPNCSEKHYIFGKGTTQEIAKEYDVPFLGALPMPVGTDQYNEAFDEIIKKL